MEIRRSLSAGLEALRVLGEHRVANVDVVDQDERSPSCDGACPGRTGPLG